MNYYPLRYQINIIDDSMAPKLVKDDIISISPGCTVDEDHIAAVLVTDDAEKTTKLYIRKIEFPSPGEVILVPFNHDYPVLEFKGGGH